MHRVNEKISTYWAFMLCVYFYFFPQWFVSLLSIIIQFISCEGVCDVMSDLNWGGGRFELWLFSRIRVEPGCHMHLGSFRGNKNYILRVTAGTAIARLSHRNSVRPSVCPSVTRVDQAKTVQARIIKSSLSAAPKTLVSGSVTLFQKFHRGHPNRGP